MKPFKLTAKFIKRVCYSNIVDESSGVVIIIIIIIIIIINIIIIVVEEVAPRTHPEARASSTR